MESWDMISRYATIGEYERGRMGMKHGGMSEGAWRHGIIGYGRDRM